MRPGYLYFTTFTWLVLTGGRFTAPFLHEVAGYDDALIGIALATQMFLGSLIGSIGSVLSDRLELKYPNKGRIFLLAGGIAFGTLAFEVHWIAQLIFKEEQSKHPNAFALHFMARILYSVSTAIVFPILDGITLSYLKRHQHINGSSRYGQERLFGAVSWAIASIVIGPILDIFGFKVFFYTAPIGSIFCFISLAKYAIDSLSVEGLLTESSGVESEMIEVKKYEHGGNGTSKSCDHIDDVVRKGLRDSEKEEVEENIDHSLAILKLLMGSYVACGFLICGFTLNMGTSIVENLIFLFFETLGGSNFICGLTVVVTVVFEIPIFHFAPKLLDFFGAENLQVIASLAYVIRAVGYTFVPKEHVSLVLLLEPLHGITYACSKTSAVEFAARITPTGYEASCQGLLTLILGFGSVIGLSLGGWVEETFGPNILYRSYAGVVGTGLILFLGACALDKRKAHEYENVDMLGSVGLDANEGLSSLGVCKDHP